MTPSPDRRHQDAVFRFRVALEAVLPDDFAVTHGWSWKPEHGSSEFIPDLMVHPVTDELVRFTGTPILCIEVVCGNRANDYVTKVTKYAQAGLVHYWIADPAEGTRNVLVRDGEHYALDKIVTGDSPVDASFGIATVSIDLAALLC